LSSVSLYVTDETNILIIVDMTRYFFSATLVVKGFCLLARLDSVCVNLYSLQTANHRDNNDGLVYNDTNFLPLPLSV